MRRIIIILFILVLVSMNTGDLFAQSQKNINEATNIVNNRGITVYNPDYAFTFFDDFFGTISSDSLWKRQTYGGVDSAFSTVDTIGGVLQILTSNTDNSGTMLKTRSKSFSFDNDEEVWVETYFSLSEVTQMAFVFGFSGTIPSDIDSLYNQEVGAFFYVKDGDDSLWCANNNSLTAIDDSYVTTLSDSTFYKLKIYFNGTDIRYFVDGTRYITHTTAANIPTGNLYGVFGYVNGAAASKYAYLDYFWITQVR